MSNITEVEKRYDLEETPNHVGYKVTFSDGIVSLVPKDTSNRHYQEILEWVAEGNTITDNGGGA